jgi:hypothetical protein
LQNASAKLLLGEPAIWQSNPPSNNFKYPPFTCLFSFNKKPQLFSWGYPLNIYALTLAGAFFPLLLVRLRSLRWLKLGMGYQQRQKIEKLRSNEQ